MSWRKLYDIDEDAVATLRRQFADERRAALNALAGRTRKTSRNRGVIDAILCRFGLILLAFFYASSASYSSGNSDYAKVKIISIGVYSNLNGKLDFKLR